MKKKILSMLGIFLFVIMLLQIKSYAGSFSISCSPSGTAEPGAKVTISVTGNNATGRINLSGTNITLSQSSVWVENNTVTLTGTTGNDGTTAKITGTATDLSDSTTAEEITGSKSVSISIKKKEVETNKTTTTQKTTTKSTTQTTKSNNNKTTTTTKPKETKVEEQVNKEEEESHKLGIYYLYLEGIKENGEKVEIKLDKEFNYDIYEYSCTVTEEITKLEIQKEAYEYNDLVQIEGIEELKYGENKVIVKVVKDGEEVVYTINIFREGEEPVETQEPEQIENENNEEPKEIIISMPLIYFILLQLGIIAIEAVVCILIIKKYKAKH